MLPNLALTALDGSREFSLAPSFSLTTLSFASGLMAGEVLLVLPLLLLSRLLLASSTLELMDLSSALTSVNTKTNQLLMLGRSEIARESSTRSTTPNTWPTRRRMSMSTVTLTMDLSPMARPRMLLTSPNWMPSSTARRTTLRITHASLTTTTPSRIRATPLSTRPRLLSKADASESQASHYDPFHKSPQVARAHRSWPLSCLSTFQYVLFVTLQTYLNTL